MRVHVSRQQAQGNLMLVLMYINDCSNLTIFNNIAPILTQFQYNCTTIFSRGLQNGPIFTSVNRKKQKQKNNNNNKIKIKTKQTHKKLILSTINLVDENSAILHTLNTLGQPKKLIPQRISSLNLINLYF